MASPATTHNTQAALADFYARRGPGGQSRKDLPRIYLRPPILLLAANSIRNQERALLVGITIDCRNAL